MTEDEQFMAVARYMLLGPLLLMGSATASPLLRVG
jgi:hypothetical protein